MNANPSKSPNLLTFPCTFPLKIVGREHEHFLENMAALIMEQLQLTGSPQLQTRSSKNARYLSLTYTAEITSQAQLDALYQALSKHPDVLWVL